MRQVFFLFLSVMLTFECFALSKAKVKEEIGAFYDTSEDYSKTVARITDRDATGTVFKVKGEDENLKFLRSGDLIMFHMPGKNKKEKCEGYVRSAEFDYLIIFVKDSMKCWKSDGHIRLGTILKIYSDDLDARVAEASIHRVALLKRKNDYVLQLRSINNFVWSYNAKRVQVSADYDQKILDMKDQKARALSSISLKKKNSINLQDDLAFKLDKIEKELEFYRVRAREFYSDRWFMDHDLGKPINKRPQPLKKKENIIRNF